MSQPITVPATSAAGFSLSPQQRQLWRLGLGDARVDCILRLAGPVALRRLRQALAAMIDRFEILRTAFRQPLGFRYPLQVILPPAPIPWRVVDLRSLEPDDSRRWGAAAERGSGRRDLEDGLPLGVTLVREQADTNLLWLALPALAADRGSARRLARELAATYAALDGGEAPAGECLQYADFAEWQNELLEAALTEQQSYPWNRFAPLSAEGEVLPFARRATLRHPFRPRALPVALPAELAVRLEAVATAQGGSLEGLLLAALVTLLWRFGAEPARVVGRVCDSRRFAELDATLGPCSRGVPLQVAPAAARRFDHLLSEVEEAIREGDELQEGFAWEARVDTGEIDGEAGYLPVLFEFDSTAWEFDAGETTFTLVKLAGWGERFLLSLLAEGRGGALRLALRYDPEHLAREGVVELADGLATLLAAIATTPTAPLSALDPLSAAARERLLERWNATDRDYPEDLGLGDLIAAAAGRRLEAVALIYADQVLSYGELNRRSNLLAQSLRCAGVGPEGVVALFAERSPVALVALLAVLKAGGVYLPLEPDLPAHRCATILRESGARWLLSERRLGERLPEFAGRVVFADTAPGDRADDPPPRVQGEHLAYLVYTSGSSGEPKGVGGTHRGAVSYLSALVARHPLGADDRALQVAPLGFDASLRDLLGPLLAGGTVVMVAGAGGRDPEELLSVAARHRVTALLSIVPSLLRALLGAGRRCGRRLPGVRLVLTSGERLARADALAAVRLFNDGAVIVNQYGPTECTMTSSWHLVDPGDGSGEAPIGRPIANARFYVVDRWLAPVPVGAPGELLIGGAGVARGYFRRPRWTAERFIADPFGRGPGQRLYATGDQVRYRPDGDLEFLGRRDQQVKLRGFRVEPGEVEEVLRRHRQVQEAVVVAREMAMGELRLVAYVVGTTAAEPPAAELRRLLAEHLPPYMVPSAIVALDGLPRTANGKIDRRALPAPEERGGTGAAFVAPRTPSEEILAGLWSEVLGIERVGVEDEFFELGGHSLLATQVMARARRIFGRELPLQILFDEPRLGALAGLIDALVAGEGLAPMPPLEPAPPGADLPLSFGQERLWLLHQLEPESAAYNVTAPLRVRGPLVPRQLERSLAEIVRRHAVLRTTIDARDGNPLQRIEEASGFRVPSVDLSALPFAAVEAEARRLGARQGRSPFDLGCDRLLRAVRLDLGPEHAALLLSTHHVASDLWSMGILIAELSACYRALAAGERPALAELPIQYADFAYWQRRWLTGEALASHLAYWRDHLAGAPAQLELPTDRSRPSVQSDRGATLEFTLSQPAPGDLHRLSRRRGVTLFITLLAAFKALLHRYGGQRDIVLGTPVAGRSHVETEPVIGFFVNTLVLRSDLSGDPSFLQLLDRVRRVVVEAHAHQELPFEKLVEELAPERDLGCTPLFQAMLSYQGGLAERLTDRALEIPGLEITPLAVGQEAAKFDLDLRLWDDDRAISGTLEFATDLFDRTSLRRLLRHYEVLLAAAAAGPDRRLSVLPLLTAVEAQQLREWHPPPPPAATGLAHQLFARQAAVQPDATAASCGDRWTSYGELNRCSNRVAHWLRRRGLEGERRVGVLGERGIGMLAVLLGVAKAGAAYLPLDPAHPDPRLLRILADSGCRLLATDRARLKRARELAGRLEQPPALWCWEHGVAPSGPDLGDLAAQPVSDPACRTAPRQLANVFYTSGSTGSPKGAMVEHAGVLNHLAAKISLLGLDARSRVAQNATHGFDISIWQFLAPLVVGGRTVIYDDATAADLGGLLRRIEEHGVTVLETAPSLLERMLAEAPASLGLDRLEFLISQAEPLPVPLARRWLARFPRVRLINGYGPTECSDDVTHQTLSRPPPPEAPRVPVGAPIAGMQIHVLDRCLQLLPPGVAGQLGLAGAGVGRGYLGDAMKTAAAFVPDPIGARPGGRLYLSGDLGRWSPLGSLEFLRRLDHQVKLHGQRIELGEVESALARHPEVRQGVVLLAEDEHGPNLAAYVVVQRGSVSAPAGGDGAPAANLTPTLLVDAYSGERMAAEALRDAVAPNAARLALWRPRRVLQIGAGSGLLLPEITRHSRTYWLVEPSASRLKEVSRRLGESPQGALGTTLRLRALDDPAGLPQQAFDLVLVEEGVGELPSLDDLERLLAGAAAALAPGGRILLTGIRNLPLLEAFQTAVELHRAPFDLPVGELRRRVGERLRREAELAVAPRFFSSLPGHLPGIGWARAELAGGPRCEERAKFRYDVVLAAAAAPPPTVVREWTELEGGLTGLGRELAEGGHERRLLRGVPHARLAADLAAVELLATAAADAVAGELRERLAAAVPSVTPEDLLSLARERGWEARLAWGEGVAAGAFDLLLGRTPAATDFAAPPQPAGASAPARLANLPWRGDPGEQLVHRLREFLGRRVPAYMVPGRFTVLAELPLTANDKVDRQALRGLAATWSARGIEHVPPRTVGEELLAALWSEVLEVERVGARDNFFDLGGHSLLANLLISRVRAAFGVELPLRSLFETPTLGEFAARIEAARQAGEGLALPPIRRRSHDGPLPLSFAQQRLWFLHQLDPADPSYNVPAAVRLRGHLDVSSLAAALGGVERRHEILRTTFGVDRGRAYQRVAPPSDLSLPTVSLEGLATAHREAIALGLLHREALLPFDLERGPLARFRLLRLEAEHHLLASTLHHIVSDGWSAQILIREAAELYRAAAAGRRAPLPELPIQYADYAVWEQGWYQGEIVERQLAYWKRQLAELPPHLALPADRPRPVVRSHHGGSVEFNLRDEIGHRIGALGRSAQATPFMVLATALIALLHRLSGQQDFALGTPVAGRNRLETEGLIGFLVNTLVLRADLSGAPTFTTLLARTRETSLDAHTHQDLPFERLVEELQPERSLNRTPFFQVLFSLDASPAPPHLRLAGLELEPVAGKAATAKFDLALEMSGAVALGGSWVYGRDLFDASTVERLARHFTVLLATAVEDPGVAVAALPLMTAAERSELLAGWSRPAPEPATTCLDALWQVQVERTPQAVALVAGDEHHSYVGLDRWAARLGGRLAGLGVGPEVVVGLCAERSAEMVAGILAILSAGGAYLPLDPTYPEERLAFMAADAATRVLLGQRRLALPRLQPETAKVFFDDDAPVSAPGGGRTLPAHPAYVIYTSGSTGRPKGVVVTHANVVRLLRATAPQLSFSAADVWTLFHSYAFDFSVWEIWGALLHGGRLVLVPYLVSRSPEELYQLLANQRVTVLNQTPSAFGQLVQVAAAHGRSGDLALRQVIFGGEALEVSGLRPWFDLYGDRRPKLVNMYGITETTVHVTVRPLSLSDLEGAGASAIGWPLADLEIFLLDPQGEPVPPRVVGEIYVGGAGLSRGYLGRPRLTAERFVPHPFAHRASERLYRSGDLARRGADGDLDYLGRLDSQVKIRGFRIEMGEIESTLAAHPAVHQAVVVSRRGAAGDSRLAAYVVVEAGATLALPELLAHLRARLPEHMVPSDVVMLRELPLTAHGKVDRGALPAPEETRPAVECVPPVTPVEELLAGVWSDLLGVEQVGRGDSFFDLGGHSILAAQLVARLREQLGVELPLRRLFAAPTLAEVATAMADALGGEGEVTQTAIERLPRRRWWPLSPAQRRFWFLQQLNPRSAAFNISSGVRLYGRVVIAALETAIEEVCRRHEALRTRLADGGDRPVQVVLPPRRLSLPLVDLGGAAGAGRLASLADRAAQRPFDLRSGAAFRGVLFRLGEEQHAMVVTLHHIVSDGWSLGVVLSEVAALYKEFAAGRPSPLPALRIQAVDYADWQRRRLEGGLADRQLAYWHRQLAPPLPTLELPGQRRRTGVPHFTGAAHPFTVDEDVVRGLRAIQRRETTTLFMALMAAFKGLLHLYTRQEDLVVGTNVTHRDRTEAERLVGCFTNTVALRTDLGGQPSFRQLLARVREVALGAYAHHDVPFEWITRALAPVQRSGAAPGAAVFQVMFVLENLPWSAQQPTGLRFESLELRHQTANFDLVLSMRETASGLTGLFIYDTDLFAAGTVARIAEQFQRLLASVVEQPDRRLTELSLDDGAEAERRVDDFNRGP